MAGAYTLSIKNRHDFSLSIDIDYRVEIIIENFLLLITNLLETLIDYSEKLYCDNNYKDQLDALKAWSIAGTKNNTQLWMQISHAGRQTPGEINSSPLAPITIRRAGP